MFSKSTFEYQGLRGPEKNAVVRHLNIFFWDNARTRIIITAYSSKIYWVQASSLQTCVASSYVRELPLQKQTRSICDKSARAKAKNMASSSSIATMACSSKHSSPISALQQTSSLPRCDASSIHGLAFARNSVRMVCLMSASSQQISSWGQGLNY